MLSEYVNYVISERQMYHVLSRFGEEWPVGLIVGTRNLPVMTCNIKKISRHTFVIRRWFGLVKADS